MHLGDPEKDWGAQWEPTFSSSSLQVDREVCGILYLNHAINRHRTTARFLSQAHPSPHVHLPDYKVPSSLRAASAEPRCLTGGSAVPGPHALSSSPCVLLDSHHWHLLQTPTPRRQRLSSLPTLGELNALLLLSSMPPFIPQRPEVLNLARVTAGSL